MSATEGYRVGDDPFEIELIRQCKLSRTVIKKIHELQQEERIGFADAGLRLGAITQDNIDSVVVAPHELVVHKHRLKPEAELLIAHDPFHDHSERVRVLRTELLLRHDSGGRNAIAVMSPHGGEGRSRLAAELAIAFSQLGQPTLLVDADLRRPRQHILFGAERDSQGLAQMISDGGPAHLHPVEKLPNLSVLTAGALVANPVELLSDGRFETLIKQWRRRFRHVIIDTSPVSEFSDALAVATLVGRVLVVTRANHTPYKSTRDVLRRLAATQANVIGAVVNHF